MSSRKSFLCGFVSALLLCVICFVGWRVWEARQLEKSVAFFKQWGELKFDSADTAAEPKTGE